MSEDDDNDVVLEALREQPLLLKGESKERYERLRDVLLAQLKPVGVLETLAALEIIDKIWEARRYKKMMYEVVEGAWHEACSYHSVNDPTSKKLTRTMAGPIAVELVKFKATELASLHLHRLDRMVANREASRRMLLKDLDRAKEKRAKSATPSNTQGT